MYSLLPDPHFQEPLSESKESWNKGAMLTEGQTDRWTDCVEGRRARSLQRNTISRRKQAMHRTPVSSLSSSLTEWPPPKCFHPRKPPALTMSIMDHSPTTGVVTVIVILIAIAALGALILGCWCYLRLQRISQSEDEESIVGDGETKEPFLLVQYSAKGPCVERKAKLMTPNGPEVHG
uniref:Stannin n=1 Tax=Piliocolobus tephrosceles TaxID=591936 RepID=A0A8C9HJ79_9PRIM